MTPPAAAAAAAGSVNREAAQVVLSQHDDQHVAVVIPPTSKNNVPVHALRPHVSPPSSPPQRAAVNTVFHPPPPPPPPCDRRLRRSPPPPARHGIPTPTTTRPMSHTAPARPLAARPDPEVPVVHSTQHDNLMGSLPAGFEMTTACPICQTAIPFDAEDAFSRHVDECISRVTSGQQPTSPPVSSLPSQADRTCPVCNNVYPASTFSQTDFERHVNDHFTDVDLASQQFEPLIS